MKFKIFLFSIICTVLSFTCVSISCNAEAVYMDPNLAASFGESLAGDSVGFSLDPIGASIGLSRLYDKLDTYLWNEYGVDIAESPYQSFDDFVDNNLTPSVVAAGQNAIIAKLSGGIYNTIEEATRAGYGLYMGGLFGMRHIVLAAKNAVTGLFDNVSDDTYVAVDDTFVNNTMAAIDTAISNDDLTNLSQSGIFYRKDVTFINGTSLVYVLHFQEPIYFANGLGSNSFRVYAVSTTTAIPASGTWTVNGQNHTIDSCFIDQSSFSDRGSFVVDGVTYYYGALGFYFDGGSGNYVTTTTNYGDIDDLVATLSGGAVVGSDVAGIYDYDPSVYQRIKAILDALKGHWVSTEDMAAVGALVQDFPVTPTLDETEEAVVPLVTPTAEDIAALQELVDSILQDSAVVGELVGDPSIYPEPDPDPVSPNQGIDIPPDFPIGVVDSLLGAVDTPFHFAEIFEPIFYVFGFFTQIYGLWLFAPVVLIGALLIWSLK